MMGGVSQVTATIALVRLVAGIDAGHAGALYISSFSPWLALMPVAALVPSALLLGASCSDLAELERRWLAWRLRPGT